jgi:hypothetical protein
MAIPTLTLAFTSVSEDSQAMAAGLAKQAQAGIEEAAAPKIES